MNIAEEFDMYLEENEGVAQIQEGFVCDSLSKADWALRHYKKHQQRMDEVNAYVDERIEQLEAFRARELEKEQKECGFFAGHLKVYAAKAIHGTKKKSADIEGARLKFSGGGQDFAQVKGMEKELMEYADPAYIVKPEPPEPKLAWGEFKKTLKNMHVVTEDITDEDGGVIGSTYRVVDENGQVVPGVTVVEKEVKFSVELGEYAPKGAGK